MWNSSNSTSFVISCYVVMTVFWHYQHQLMSLTMPSKRFNIKEKKWSQFQPQFYYSTSQNSGTICTSDPITSCFSIQSSISAGDVGYYVVRTRWKRSNRRRHGQLLPAWWGQALQELYGILMVVTSIKKGANGFRYITTTLNMKEHFKVGLHAISKIWVTEQAGRLN